jgi:transcription initiation factor TFIID subunit 1
MGTLINNYYRKKDEKDEFVPDNHEGAPVVLEHVDASPFFLFGDIKPGESISCLYNNLFRAPIFEHASPKHDFLLIRHISKNETRYYLRNIPSSFVVGQTFPLVEVPGVHSRKVNTYLKNRVVFTAWRFFKKSPEQQVKISQLLQLFRDATDANIRKYIKDFAEGMKGKDTGVWVLKPNVTIPSEEELRQLVTPEMACQYESMLAGQQRLKDSGYVQLTDDVNEDEEQNLEDEVKLAPWITTRNFINACQGKAMLQLYGAGDPTGCGEGFSFLRASMKAMFFKEGEDPESKITTQASGAKFSIAEQQQAYKDEIARIWNAQKTTLGSSQELEMDDNSEQQDERTESANISRVQTPTIATSNRVVVLNKVMDDDAFSVASFESRNSSRLDVRAKTLTITRSFKDANGNINKEVEIITNSRVINAYVRQKQLQEARRLSLLSGKLESPQEK